MAYTRRFLGLDKRHRRVQQFRWSSRWSALSDGVFVSSARFDQDDMRDSEAGELAHVVRRARDIGVNVTG